MRNLNLAIFAFATVFCGFAVADNPSILVPADVKLAAHIDVNQIKASSFLETLSIQRDGKRVTVTLDVPQDLLAEQLAGVMAN